MNKIFTKIWNNKPVLWRIFFFLLNTLFSVLCAFITQNIIFTIMFIIGTVIIDILVEIQKYLNLEEQINKIFKSKCKYSFFVFCALSPTILGTISKEIDILDNFPSKLFDNLVPNILGVCIVCSIMNHIAKFGYERFVYVLLQSKKELINTFVRIAYFGCFLNAVNYNIDAKLKCTNIFNSIYLFIIVFCGSIVVVSFVLRIIDQQRFNHTAVEIYPSKTLFWGELFLISCGIGPIFFENGKHEPILLIMNSITACMISIFLFLFIMRRTENKSNLCPFKPVFWFIIISILNCSWNYYKWDKTGNISQQIYSGLAIFAFVCELLLYVYITQGKETFVIKYKIEEYINELDHEIDTCVYLVEENINGEAYKVTALESRLETLTKVKNELKNKLKEVI